MTAEIGCGGEMPGLVGEVIIQGSKEAGLVVDDQVIKQMEVYSRLLLAWNERVNLTAITDPRDVGLKHFVDSLLCCRYVDFQGSQENVEPLRMIDVGTGAGFPGMVLKLYQAGLKVTLLDSLQKRIKFLEAVKEELKLTELTIVHGRAEDCGQDGQLRERFDRVVSRAVARLDVLSEYCLPFTRVGGLFVAMKAGGVQSEVDVSMPSIEALGGRVRRIVEYQLPVSGDERSLVIVEKVGPTPIKYPRKAGVPAKKPLAGKS